MMTNAFHLSVCSPDEVKMLLKIPVVYHSSMSTIIHKPQSYPSNHIRLPMCIEVDIVSPANLTLPGTSNAALARVFTKALLLSRAIDICVSSVTFCVGAPTSFLYCMAEVRHMRKICKSDIYF